MSILATLPGGATELVLERTLNAPRELVFAAWTDPKEMARWWGPKGFTNPVCDIDVRPGGAMHIVMRGPDGSEYPCGGSFREIAPPERLVFTTWVVKGEPGSSPLIVLNTVTFEDLGAATKLTLRAELVQTTADAAAPLSGMEQGWSQSLDRLATLVSRASAIEGSAR